MRIYGTRDAMPRGAVRVHTSPLVVTEQLDCIHWDLLDGAGAMSGIVATLLAMHLGCTDIYLAGFDNDGSGLYLGTRGYKLKRSTNEGDGQEQRMRELVATVGAEYHVEPNFYQIPPHTFPWMRRTELPEAWKA